MSEQVESILKSILQYNVEFRSTNNSKCLRKGVIQLYSIKDFFVSFIIKTHKGDNKNYQMPYPYNIDFTQGKIIFDYRLKNIHNDQQHIMHMLEQIGESRSPFYDNVIEIVKV